MTDRNPAKTRKDTSFAFMFTMVSTGLKVSGVREHRREAVSCQSQVEPVPQTWVFVPMIGARGERAGINRT
jgi:hypothetical protein